MEFDKIVVYSIGTIILVGSWIANLLKKQAEQRKADEIQLRRTSESSPPSEAAGSTDRQTLAEHRREQLRQMTRQRAQPPDPGRAGPVEPANLTMAERISRARAKAQYERRARELAKQARQAPSTAPPPAAPQHRAPVEVLPTEMAARQRELARRGARPPVGSGQVTGRIQPPRGRPPREPLAAVAAPHAPIDDGESVVHRHVSDTATTSAIRPALSDTATSVRRRLNQSGLRDAIVLKEILDKPVAMRQPEDSARV